MQTEDPTAIAFLTNLLRLWSFERHDLPTDFVDEVTLTQLARQPIALVDVQLELIHRELQPVSSLTQEVWLTRTLGQLTTRLNCCPRPSVNFPPSQKLILIEFRAVKRSRVVLPASPPAHYDALAAKVGR